MIKKIFIHIFLSIAGWILFLPFILFGLTLAGLLLVIGKKFMLPGVFSFGFNIAHAIDQFGNVLLLGDSRETISSRTGRALVSKKPKWFVKPFAKLIDFLAFKLVGQKNHVIEAIDKYPEYDREIISWIKK